MSSASLAASKSLAFHRPRHVDKPAAAAASESPAPKTSSALKQLVDDFRTDSAENPPLRSSTQQQLPDSAAVQQESPSSQFAKSAAMSQNYERMQQDLRSLQDKIHSLESKLSVSAISTIGKDPRPQKEVLREEAEEPLRVSSLEAPPAREPMRVTVTRTMDQREPERPNEDSIEKIAYRSKTRIETKNKKSARQSTAKSVSGRVRHSGGERSSPGKEGRVEAYYKEKYEEAMEKLGREKKASGELKKRLEEAGQHEQELKAALEKSERARRKQKETIEKLQKEPDRGKGVSAPQTKTRHKVAKKAVGGTKSAATTAKPARRKVAKDT